MQRSPNGDGGFNYFSHRLNWSRSAEFPPSVVAEIIYGYGVDASRANDDCNLRNNRFELSGTEINRQLATRSPR